MKAFLLKDAFGIENLVLDDVELPVPGAGQVLVKMRAWSLNFRDLLVTKGIYAPKLKFPFQMLSDGVGEIAAVGSDVEGFSVGDRVSGIFMQAWREGALDAAKAASALGGNIAGVAAEYVIHDATSLVRVPDHLSDEEAATLPCAAVTAWNALVSSGNLKAGDTVLTLGTGGVSIFALQFAKMMGAKVIATSSSEAKLERVRAMGADETINYKTTTEWGRAVRDLTGEGVDHVVEVGGAGTLGQSMDAVCNGGRISLIGVLTGGTVNPLPLLMKGVTLQGIFVGSRAMFEDMNRAIAANAMRPVVDKVFAFSELREALQHMQSGSHFGKIVLKV